MTTVIFVGPSLIAKDRAAIRDASVLPPIRRGDLAIYSEYDLFVILDGEFGQSMSVSPKEILRVLDQGKTVVGAASMGALRAAELDSFGMIGVGWVYRHFIHASVRREDDVALCYSPFDLTPTSVPMIDLEYMLTKARSADLLSSKEQTTVLRRARMIYFADRTQDDVNEILIHVLGVERFDQVRLFFGGEFPSVKALDAREALNLAFRLQEHGA